MLHRIKQFVKAVLFSTVHFVGKSKIGAYIFELIVNASMQATQKITHSKISLIFSVSNQLNRYRVDSFSTKEPETLEWIDSFPRGSVVWDIGANVGLYSCYAAQARGCKVFSFEPSVFNLELLARNIFLNSLTASVTIIPLPLSHSLAFNTLNMTSMEWGGHCLPLAKNTDGMVRKSKKYLSFRLWAFPPTMLYD